MPEILSVVKAPGVIIYGPLKDGKDFAITAGGADSKALKLSNGKLVLSPSD